MTSKDANKWDYEQATGAVFIFLSHAVCLLVAGVQEKKKKATMDDDLSNMRLAYHLSLRTCEAFDWIDSDGNRSISRRELEDALTRAGMAVDAVVALFRGMDLNSAWVPETLEIAQL